jgi:hypothetical protein
MGVSSWAPCIQGKSDLHPVVNIVVRIALNQTQRNKHLHRRCWFPEFGSPEETGSDENQKVIESKQCPLKQ